MSKIKNRIRKLEKLSSDVNPVIVIIVPPGAIEQNDGINWKKIQNTPPLEKQPQPVVNTTQMARKDPITNLTSTETALLSPTEKVIAGRT